MPIDFRAKKPSDILEYFSTHVFEADAIVELKLLTSDIDTIGYKAFVDLAQLFYMKMLSPISTCAVSASEEVLLGCQNEITLRFKKLNQASSFHKAEKNSETYGVGSEFFSIDKTAEFSFLYHYQKALEFVNLKSRKRVLDLGINKGDEFKVIEEMLSDEEFSSKEFVGVDYSQSAIEYAKNEFPHANTEFVCGDINRLQELELGRFDLLISIGTLQSSSMNFNQTFMSLYQEHLEKDGAIILGFPNCRWIDGEMIYGAKAPNYAFSEMSLVLKDIHFCKKYLQQKKYRVVITGKDYLFLSARKIG